MKIKKRNKSHGILKGDCGIFIAALKRQQVFLFLHFIIPRLISTSFSPSLLFFLLLFLLLNRLSFNRVLSFCLSSPYPLLYLLLLFFSLCFFYLFLLHLFVSVSPWFNWLFVLICLPKVFNLHAPVSISLCIRQFCTYLSLSSLQIKIGMNTHC